MKRERYWLCERCGLIWHRRKSGRPWYHCGVLLKPSMRWARTSGPVRNQHGGRARVNCRCPGGGWYNVPTLEFNDRLGISTLGQWRRSLMRGHAIEVNGSRNIRKPHWLGTLIHEAIHWSDATSYNRANPSRSVAMLSHVGPHSPAFKQRMAYLAKAIGYKGVLDDDDD